MPTLRSRNSCHSINFMCVFQIFGELYRSSPKAQEWFPFFGHLFFLILYLRRRQACWNHWYSSGQLRWYEHITDTTQFTTLSSFGIYFVIFFVTATLAFIQRVSPDLTVVLDSGVSVAPTAAAVVGAPLTDITMSTKAMSVVSVTSQCSYSSTIVHVPQPESGIKHTLTLGSYTVLKVLKIL